MDLPTYIQEPDQENYNEELNQTLRDNLSDNGWVQPSLTAAQIIVAAAFMPDGTTWYCIDHVPPVYVGKISGALVKFTTAAFP
jgi:hypothetical protein